MKTQSLPTANRFAALTVAEDGTSCILFKGAKNSKGYGRFSLGDKKEILAHRYAWEQVNGPVPEGFVIEHICQNPACVNVDHMRLVEKNSKRLVVVADEEVALTEEAVENYPELQANFPEVEGKGGELPNFNIEVLEAAKELEHSAINTLPIIIEPEPATAEVKEQVESELEATEWPAIDEAPKAKESKGKGEKKPRTYAIPGGEPAYCKLGHLKTVPRVYPNGIRLQCGECAKIAAQRAKDKKEALKKAAEVQPVAQS